MSSSTDQRTLALLFAPECHQHAARARQVLLDGGLRLLQEATLLGEELEEAGIDLGLGVGEGGVLEDGKEDEDVHVVLVLGGTQAVDRLKELKASSLANACPALRIFAAPSPSAANMAIDTLFPSLPTSPAPQSPSIAVFPSTAAPTGKPKPFALSNLAFTEGDKRASPPNSARGLSPSIERALEELEEREERRRKSSSGTRSTKSSVSTPRIASRASGFASTYAEDGFVQDEQEMTERRVFTAHSCEASEGYDSAATDEQEQEQEQEAEDEEEHFPGEADALSETSNVHSPSTLSAPTLSRVASSISSASATSSTPSASSFRARPAPASTARPALQPRLSKAAALRLGVSLPPSTPRRSSSEASSSVDAALPAVPRVVPTPKSLAAPSIAPRMTKSASLRGGQDGASTRATPRPTKRQSISTAERAAMDRLARRHSVQVPSIAAAPAVEVRLSRAAMLRQGMQPPPTAPRLVRQSSATSAEDLRPASSASSATTGRTSVSANLKALREPTVVPRSTRASAMRAGGGSGSVSLESPSMSRGRSLGTLEDLVAQQQGSLRAKQPVDFDGVPGHKRRESIQVRATQPPKVEVRMSRAAKLRSGIAEEDEGGSTPMRRAKTEPVPNMYESVPGAHRRDPISVASTKAPSITPRLNRAVLLRQTGDGPSSSSSSSNFRRPASALASTTASTASSSLAVPSAAPPRAPSAQSASRPAAAAPAAPAIAPRLNKAAELRAAKKAGATSASAVTPVKRKVIAGQAAGKGVQNENGKGSRPSTALGLALRETTNSPGPQGK
ncbi:hypothetical protein JCM6882_008824 [Rhodosporidiobolus microsporus]